VKSRDEYLDNNNIGNLSLFPIRSEAKKTIQFIEEKQKKGDIGKVGRGVFLSDVFGLGIRVSPFRETP
jgi:hypothetical protein